MATAPADCGQPSTPNDSAGPRQGGCDPVQANGAHRFSVSGYAGNLGTGSDQLLQGIVEHYDAPAIRTVVADAAGSGYAFSSLVLGIVESVPFQMREAAEESEQGENR